MVLWNCSQTTTCPSTTVLFRIWSQKSPSQKWRVCFRWVFLSLQQYLNHRGPYNTVVTANYQWYHHMGSAKKKLFKFKKVAWIMWNNRHSSKNQTALMKSMQLPKSLILQFNPSGFFLWIFSLCSSDKLHIPYTPVYTYNAFVYLSFLSAFDSHTSCSSSKS